MGQQRITVAGDTLSMDAAQTCIGRYCSAPGERWEPDTSRAVDVVAADLRFYNHGYRAYDCVAGDPGQALTPLDVIVAAGLGAGLAEGPVDGMLGLLPVLNPVLQELPDPPPVFWEMSREALFDDGGLAAFGGAMWRAWAMLMNLHGVTMLTTHAVLHHKLPTLFPLLDRRTIGHFARRSTAWREIHEDLLRDASSWEILEAWHRDTIVPRSPISGAVPLNRLRMHAIILEVRTT